MHGNVPVRFGRGRLDSLDTKGLAAYLMRKALLASSGLFGSGRSTRNLSPSHRRRSDPEARIGYDVVMCDVTPGSWG
jgi:hypothetical protein